MCVSLSSSCWQHVLVLGSRGRAATLATLPPHSLAQPPSFDAIVSRLFSSPRRTMTPKWCGLRPPAPRDHPPAFVRYRLPRAPETWTPFTRGCMTSEPSLDSFREGPPGAFSEFSGCQAHQCIASRTHPARPGPLPRPEHAHTHRPPCRG